MELIRGLHTLRAHHRECVATIGNFDGVHRGHQAILEQLKTRARALNLPVTVVIFEPQPREYFAGDQAPPRLTRMKEKLRLLKAYGADRVLCLPFNQKLRELSADDFIERVLVDGLGVRHLVVGDDFRFGCDRAGNFDLLKEKGARHGFDVEHTHTFMLDDERVSSTRVRTLLASGNFRQAAHQLGRPYVFMGRVVKDRQLGRTIGIPTANVPLLPGPMALRGVYAVQALLDDGVWYPGVANVGWRPTVGSSRPVLEVHLLDTSPELYGRPMMVMPCARLRGEEKFDGLEAMLAQIKHDIALTRRYFNALPFTGGQMGEASFDDADLTLPVSDRMDTLLASAPLTYASTDHDDG
ncbi:bifunctional riboflavin kinase/FAD synthetase [Larsenimonas suaedae]|uniref:Riboflavin biosynthesis protein n=1 Tax=Larsenimonas suaedae TaxID=1851019 RepID=A0ABU1H085_9GAMM|nr:bifunctional riboflavin kinase/FAD synthetase [Larsenimonas suaedae]MCM2973699.1 bifunctional riboflavin kinase/FAD synthetase [Larsenimonas suaedae]MDR5897167.1 bifunctional riboflavin kinase/FAD synthetase [Larsenimonas suaedae]